jgi:flagellin
MALVINTNLGSIKAERALAVTRADMETSMQRLSSGKRINSAHDDAAGIAVASRMQDQIQGLNVAIRNASDGIGIAQTADSAIEEMQNVLHRMRELAVQAVNGTYNDEDRSHLNAEYSSLMSELSRTASTTTWDKDLKLLDDGVNGLDIQIGTAAGMAVSIPISAMTPRSIGLKVNLADNGVVSNRTTTYDMQSFGASKQSGGYTAGDDYLLDINGLRLTAEDAHSVEDVASKLSQDYNLTGSGIKSIASDGKAPASLVITWLDSACASDGTPPAATLTWSRDTTNIATAGDATNALTAIDLADQLASDQRAKLGAAMNRIQHTINTLLNVVQNVDESKSRIFDTDFAAESAALARSKVLADAGTAMLAQANQSQQYVMNLLRGGG